MEFMYIKEVAQTLAYKDFRSAEKWCMNHRVEIFSEKENNRKYVMRRQFEYARLKKFIEYLKVKYKSEWFEAFKAYTSMNITSVVEIEEKEKITFSLRTDNYKPQGHHEISFLNSLTENIHEL